MVRLWQFTECDASEAGETTAAGGWGVVGMVPGKRRRSCKIAGVFGGRAFGTKVNLA